MDGATACFVVCAALIGLIFIVVAAYCYDSDGAWLLVIAVALTIIMCRTAAVNKDVILRHLDNTGNERCAVCGGVTEEVE